MSYMDFETLQCVLSLRGYKNHSKWIKHQKNIIDYSTKAQLNPL